uniref:Uncharacterized protein n=1 Tax=Anguilla anguilla TaxID=7936 RepID=A0A0E9XCH0_ANGAN
MSSALVIPSFSYSHNVLVQRHCNMFMTSQTLIVCQIKIHNLLFCGISGV